MLYEKIESQALVQKMSEIPLQKSLSYYPSETSQQNEYQQQPLNQSMYNSRIVTRQPYFCEVENEHKEVLASKKCALCNKLMCIKCTSYYSYGLYGRYSGMYLTRESCGSCKNIMEEKQGKWRKIYIANILMMIFGTICFPLLILGILFSLYWLFTTPKNDNFNISFRKQLFIYVLIDFLLLVCIFVLIFTLFIVLY